MNGKNWNKIEIDKLKDLSKSGKDITYISKFINRPYTSILKKLRKLKININWSKRILSSSEKEVLILDYKNSKLSYKELSIKYKISQSYLYKLIKESGLSRRAKIERNLQNHKFDKLTVLELAENNSLFHKTKWKCLCECGNITIKYARYLIASRNRHIANCGCVRKMNVGKNNVFWEGYEEISKSFFGAIKRGAEFRGINYNLDIKFLWKLFLKQERKCSLSGIELKFKSKHNYNDGTASLDRIDSSKGYTEDNVQWIHKDINKMKMDFDEKYFVEMCKLITNNQNHAPIAS